MPLGLRDGMENEERNEGNYHEKMVEHSSDSGIAGNVPDGMRRKGGGSLPKGQ